MKDKITEYTKKYPSFNIIIKGLRKNGIPFGIDQIFHLHNETRRIIQAWNGKTRRRTGLHIFFNY